LAQYILYGRVKASIFTCAAVRLGCPTFCETSLVIVVSRLQAYLINRVLTTRLVQ